MPGDDKGIKIPCLLYYALGISPSGPIYHQLSVTEDEAVGEASDVDEPANAEGVCFIVSVVTFLNAHFFFTFQEIIDIDRYTK